MNRAKTTTIRQLIPSYILRGNLTAQAAYDLAMLHRRDATWETMLDRPVRIPSLSLLECVRMDLHYELDELEAQYGPGHGLPVLSVVDLMRDGIADGLSYGGTGRGNRAARRMGAIRSRYIPAAPRPVHHLVCA